MISWLQNHLLICPFKYVTGIDCPGCGFQRAVLLLLKGNIYQSVAIYPPAIPLIAFFIYLIAATFLKIDNQNGMVKKSFFILVGVIVFINYAYKIYALHSN